MKEGQGDIKIANFIAYSIIIIIVIYMTASTIVSFLPVQHQTFTVIFTLSGAIPALTLLFKEKCMKSKQ
jgi:hypothetical protein